MGDYNTATSTTSAKTTLKMPGLKSSCAADSRWRGASCHVPRVISLSATLAPARRLA
ncbi:MAG: hypothetical protein HND48_00335 [Chloroflexi bacterium]|nr:hypothetical protein [Chloroflexota bacterium]